MTDDIVPPAPRHPETAVYVNGAAVNLITSLTEGLRRDMRAMEDRLSDDIQERFAQHGREHDAEALHFSRATDRITVLELDDIEDDRIEAIRKARREGQLSIFLAMRRVATFGERYGRTIAVIVAAIIGFLLALASDRITSGP